ncbi:MAG: hypothetical protein KDC38_11475, partial [Planctomycetes bacterium]|nr:hypothetical protein [Planctomycetota bacterium]
MTDRVLDKHLCGPARWALVAALVWTWGTGVACADLYSFLLDPNSPEYVGPNRIYTWNPENGLVTAVTDRLHLALVNADPPVEADALSYGLDAFDLDDPHGKLIFGLRSTTPDGPEVYPYNEAFYEKQSDYEADLYMVDNIPALGPNLGAAAKVLEENSANLPGNANWILPTAHHGLTGGATGSPRGLPSKLRGFDLRSYSNANDIYFSIDQTTRIGATTYHPADILRLDPSGTIHVFVPSGDLDLGEGDDIDALSLDLRHSQQLGQVSNGVFSLSPGSALVQSGSYSAADLFQYRDGVQVLNLYRTALSVAVQPGDGDIGTVVSIDPNRFGANVSISRDGTDISISFPSDIDGVTVLVEETWVAVLEASATVSLASTAVGSLSPGDERRVDVLGHRNGVPFLVSEVVVYPPTSTVTGWLTPTVDPGVPSTVHWVPTIESGVPPQSWEVWIDGEFSEVLPYSPTGFTTSDLALGVRHVAAFAIEGGGRSAPLHGRVVIDAPEEQPEIEGVTPSSANPRIFEIHWDDHLATPMSVEIEGGSAVLSTTATTSPFTTSELDYGYYRGRLGRADGLSESTRFDFFVLPPPQGSLLRGPVGTTFSSVDIAYSASAHVLSILES